MQIVRETISVEELKKMFGNLVKAVVDIEKEIMIVDTGLHVDEEQLLLENGSERENLWGINIFPNNRETDSFIVFNSMINLRPSWGNMSRGVDNPQIQEKIKRIVNKLIV